MIDASLVLGAILLQVQPAITSIGSRILALVTAAPWEQTRVAGSLVTVLVGARATKPQCKNASISKPSLVPYMPTLTPKPPQCRQL